MKAGRILLFALILGGVWGVAVNGASIYTKLLYLGVLLTLFSWTWTILLGRSLIFHRSARVQRASVGDVFEERFDIVNGSRLPAPWIEVTNESRLPFSSGSRLLTQVYGKQKRNYLGRTWLTQRGAFSLGPTRVSTGDPLGLFRWNRSIPATQTLIILPMIFEIKSFISPPGILPGGQVIRRKSADVTPHASGVREYAYGDAMKKIHWPTSIRRNRLMVKEFELDPQAEVWLFLDSQKGVHLDNSKDREPVAPESLLFGRVPKFQLPMSTLEYAISIAASLAHYYLSQRRAVGYVSAGQTFTVLPAERSMRQEMKILETLAFVEANGDLSVAGLVEAQASQLPQGSSAILITPTVHSDLLIAVDVLQRRLLRPVVVMIETTSFGGPPGAGDLARRLKERNLPAVEISCGAELVQALSEIPSSAHSQDARSWQRPILSHLT